MMKKTALALMLASSVSLGACSTYNNDGMADAATGAAVGAGVGAVAGAAIPGVSTIAGAAVGAAVGGLAGDLEVVGRGEQGGDAGAHHRVVVDEQHAGHGRTRLWSAYAVGRRSRQQVPWPGAVATSRVAPSPCR